MIFPPRSKFNFDTALRYVPIVEMIEKSKWKKYPVLEVGSGVNGISDFYKGFVIGIDSDFSKTKTEKNANIKHVRGSILKLPFQNEEFSQIVCLDTLEHISKQVRAEAVGELLRVTKRGGQIYLGFPCGELASKVENLINALFKSAHGTNHPWLLQHKKYGLPKKEELIAMLENYGIKENKMNYPAAELTGYPSESSSVNHSSPQQAARYSGSRIKILNNTNLFIWFVIHLTFTVYNKSLFSNIVKFAYKLLFNLCKVKIPPFYRVILVIDK